MSRRNGIVLAAMLLFAGLAGTGLKFGLFLWRPLAPEAPRQITILPGSSFASVAQRLHDAGVVAGAFELRLLARLRGDARKVQAGEYDFSDSATPGRVLDRLTAGDVRRYRFTLPEGLNLRETAGRIEADGFGDGETFLRLAGDPELAARLGIPSETLEGYLFPETYTIIAGTSEERLIELMVEQFRAHLTPEITAAAAQRGLSVHQLVTLASVIEKEAGNTEEMPLISAVFHTRLEQGMRLQADPTVIYGIENFDGNLTRAHLETPSPYNTYRKRGLPAGPIANPGAEALHAAAFPAEVDFLYFVSRGDGTHVFSRTLREHNRMVRKYQLGR